MGGSVAIHVSSWNRDSAYLAAGYGRARGGRLSLPLWSGDGAGAQSVVDPTSCGHFETQADAQTALDSGAVPNPEQLDWDGDGIACEDAFGLDPDSPPPARDYASCGSFVSQAAAQQVLDAGTLPNPEALDWDGDGIACEDVFGTAGITTLPSTGSGSMSAGNPIVDALWLAGIFAAITGAGLALRRAEMR